MPVYQPSGIIGNGRALVGVGERGELMSFYYPRIDFPQNLNQGMPALYLGEPEKGHLEWTFEGTWQAEQTYLGRSNILHTHCPHRRLGLEVLFTDFVSPDLGVLVRQVEMKNAGADSWAGTFYQYLDLQLGEVQSRNAVRWIAERGLFAQYWRNMAFAIGGDRFDQYGCGKAGAASPNSAKLGMAKGRLNSNSQEIGDVDLAVGWNLRLAPGEKTTRLLFISAAGNEEQAVRSLEEAYRRGYQALLQGAEKDARTFLAGARSLKIPADLEEGYWRSLLVLRLLFDESYGAFLAAPEFDPAFERSGGYGYCWPRDAAEVVLALEAVGLREMGLRFLQWARSTQNEDGSWEQRYWLNGERGPAWCTQEGYIQLDQVGSMLLAMERLLSALPDPEEAETLARFWPAVKKAADYLAGQIDPDTGLHRSACDLWETFRGSFTYTNAAIWAGLRAAAGMGLAAGRQEEAGGWEQAAALIKQSVLRRLWTGAFFARGLDPSGVVEPVVDSSVLGLIDPFQMLDLEEQSEREMAEASIRTIEQHLSVDLDGKKGIARFEGDRYLGGSAGGVNTLWLARALLRLSVALQEKEPGRAREYEEKALEYIRLVKSRATPAGMLPELIGGPGAPSRWAAPHGWTTASYIVNMLLLDRLGNNKR